MSNTALSIILPVFNEEATIAEVIRRLQAVSLTKEIIVVDDGSSDATAGVLESLCAAEHFKLLRHPRNLGKGAAVRTGIKEAQGEFVVIQDADLEQEPADIVKMVNTAREHNLDAVFGTRILNWGFEFDIRYVANMLFALLTNILFKAHLTDIMTGYKLCRTQILKSLSLKSRGFEIEPEIAAKLLKKKVKICEIPISYKPRSKREGKKIRFRDSFRIVYRLLLERLSPQ